MNFDNIPNRYQVIVKKTYYANERYNLDFSFALIYHKYPIGITELSQYVRISDIIINIDASHHFIIFQYTSQEDAFKASQNLIYSLDKHFNTIDSCYIALDKLNSTITPMNLLKRLDKIIDLTRKNRLSRVETEIILDME